MGSVERQQGVLKLVHPGRHVEIHKEPITAAEVLKKNPRHSVTRPDVFEHPWIVVRPESVLNLGRVFYIVPNATIYKLIKAKGYSIQPSLQQNQSPKSYVHRKLLKQTSPRKSSAGGTPKHQDHCQSDWQQFQSTCWEDHCQSDWQQFQSTCWEEASPQEQAGGERFNRPSQFESLADMITKYQSTYKEFKQMSVTDSTPVIDSLDDKEYHFSEVSSSKAAALKQDDALGIECKQQVSILKSCLSKHDSARKLLHLKVSFFLPTKCEERKRKVTKSRAESPSFFTS
ncbi:hypothetical protein CRYUN_Cryun14cG0136000 [Craigia yunnanensis]